MRNEPPFKKKQLTKKQDTQSNAQDIPLKTVLDDLPPQVTPAMMSNATSLQVSVDASCCLDTTQPRIYMVE